jgi:hypothetical protein
MKSMLKCQTIGKTYDPSKLVGFTPSATKKLENVFGSFDDILSALAPKPVDRARLRKQVARNTRRYRRRLQKESRALDKARKEFKMTAINGAAARARPHCAGGCNFKAPPRWPILLDLMGDRERTVRELRAMFDRPRDVTRYALERRLIPRGLVEKRPNPNPRPAVMGICGAADKWLYRRTEAGAAYVAAEAKQGPPKEAVDTRSEIDGYC